MREPLLASLLSPGSILDLSAILWCLKRPAGIFIAIFRVRGERFHVVLGQTPAGVAWLLGRLSHCSNRNDSNSYGSSDSNTATAMSTKKMNLVLSVLGIASRSPRSGEL